MKHHKKYLFTFLLFLFILPTISAAQAAFDPRPEGGIYSDEDWGVYVQLVYGSLEGYSVFIPQQASILPRPELWVVMGGMERLGERNITIETYEYNRTMLDFTTLYNRKNYTIHMGEGGDPHFAMRKIDFPTIDDAMKCKFIFKDILINFRYQPNPIYLEYETSKADAYFLAFLYVVLTASIVGISEVAGRRLQRRVAVIPPFPIVESIAIVISAFTLILMVYYIQFPYNPLEKIIFAFMQWEVWLLEIPLFFSFTLWLGHRHSPDSLRTVQMYYSKFEGTKSGEDKQIEDKQTKEKRYYKKANWIADMNTKFRAYELKSKWYICDPKSWTQFLARLFGSHIEMEKYEYSIRPDKGYWHKNNERLFVGMVGMTKQKARLIKGSKWGDLDLRTFSQTIGLLVVAGFCILVVGMNLVTGGFGFILLVAAAIMGSYGMFGKGSFFELLYMHAKWIFDPIRFREAELILTEHEQFLDMQDKINDLEAANNTLKTNFYAHVAVRVRKYTIKLDEMLSRLPLIYKFIDKEKRYPTEKDIESETFQTGLKEIRDEKVKELGKVTSSG